MPARRMPVAPVATRSAASWKDGGGAGKEPVKPGSTDPRRASWCPGASDRGPGPSTAAQPIRIGERGAEGPGREMAPDSRERGVTAEDESKLREFLSQTGHRPSSVLGDQEIAWGG